MNLHLLDGTYELFRAYYGLPSIKSPDGREVAATRGLIQTLLVLLRQEDVTHVACAFDHVVESFRNDLFDGYKTGDGMPEDIKAQFELAERAARALGVVIWPMTEFEADDAIAAAAVRWQDDPRLGQVVICSPDKDLAQMVTGDRVVAWDRRRDIVMDEAGVRAKFGVGPASIPDYLALVGDAADGFPGIPKWGAKTTAQVLGQYATIEQIPDDAAAWTVKVRRRQGSRRQPGCAAGRGGAVQAAGHAEAGRAAGRGPGRPGMVRRSPSRIPGPVRRAWPGHPERRPPPLGRRVGKPVQPLRI